MLMPCSFHTAVDRSKILFSKDLREKIPNKCMYLLRKTVCTLWSVTVKRFYKANKLIATSPCVVTNKNTVIHAKKIPFSSAQTADT